MPLQPRRGRSASAGFGLSVPCGPIDLGPVQAWRAAVFRCLKRPSRTDRVSHCPSFFPSCSTGGKSAPFQVGSLHPCGWPYPAYYWRACAFSHLLYPLGIGRLYSRLRQLSDHPWGFPCSVSRRCNAVGSPSPSVEVCPIDGPTPDRPILSTSLLVRASQPLWLFRLHEVCRGSPCSPERLSSRPLSGCGCQRAVLFGVLHTPPLPETHDADEERRTGSPRSS